MTPLNKPVRRKATNTLHRGRCLIIELRPGVTETLYIREEKRRMGYLVPLEAIYKLGARLHAESVRKDRAAKKKKKAGKNTP